MRWISAAIVLLISSGALAADRTQTTDCTWTAVNAGCFGNLGAATDNFTIGNGTDAATVTIPAGATIGVTTGGIAVANNATLLVQAGADLQYGDGTGAGGNAAGAGLQINEGGHLRQEGTLLATCYITSTVDWTNFYDATHHTVSASVDCDMTGVSTTTDYVFFADEDPASLDAVLTGRCVSTGPGRGTAGCYRPAYNKWASYKITGATNPTLTWDPVPELPSSGTPYAGSRYGAATGGEAGNLITYTPRWLKRTTKVEIPVAYSASVCTIAADRGSWYLSYDEGAGTCSGKQAKILSCTDNGAADILEVQGDVSGCTDAASVARLTTGARRGDKVYIYRPASLNGNTNGAATTSGEGAIVNFGGSWYAHWARMHQQWGFGTATPSPAFLSSGNLIFAQGATGVSPTADWDWVDIAYPDFSDNTDVGVVYIESNVSGSNWRFPNIGPVDLAASTFRHLHIHDGKHNDDTCPNTPPPACGGTHGIFIDGAKNADFAQVRVERMNDDGIVGQFVKGDGTSDDRNSVTIRHALVYEQIGNLTSNLSQEGVEFDVVDADTTLGPTNISLSTPMRFQDVLIMGAQDSELVVPTGLGIYKGITTGGGAFAPAGVAGSNNVQVRPVQPLTLDDAAGSANTYGSRFYDSNLNVLGPTTANAPIQISGYITGSFISGYDAVGATTKSVDYIGNFDRTVVDLGASKNSGGYLMVDGANALEKYRSMRVIDSVFRSTNSTAKRFMNHSSSQTNMNNLIARTMLLLGSPEVLANGIFVNWATGGTIANSLTTIQGLYVTSDQATPQTAIAAGSPDMVDVQQACMEGTLTTNVFGGDSANGTTRIISDPLTPPSSDTTVVLRDLVAPWAATCAGYNKPLALGYENFRIGHAQLGDFEIENFARSSSDNLITVNAAVPTHIDCQERWPSLCD